MSHEIGAIVVDGVQQVLSRVQNEARGKGIDAHAHATGVMDGMIHMLATCAVWMINSKRGRSRELNSEEANAIHERFKSSLIDARLRLIEAEIKRLGQAEDLPEADESAGHA